MRGVHLAIFPLVGEGFLEAVEDRLVRCFGLPIALRISRCGHVLLDAILLEELSQIFAHKLRAIVGDDGLRDAKSTNDVPPYEKTLCLSKVIGYHDHHAPASSSGRHWPYQVDCPLHERPRTCLRV
ncbi:hypothetical protein EV1_003088 [Malus domestica]